MGKGGEMISKNELVSSALGIREREVLIDGELYDISELRHPGGKVINFYSGNAVDATQAFNNFHFRSKRAKKLLESLPRRKADMKLIQASYLPGQLELLTDFNNLQRNLESEGLFDPHIPHVFYRLMEAIAVYCLGYGLIFNGYPVVGAVIAGINCGRCGWIMHEAGHYSLSGNIKLDRFLQNIVIGLSCCLSSSYWRSQHNKHHSMPQRLEHDVDLNTIPLVAFSKAVVTRDVLKVTGPGLKFWLRFQAYLFPIVITFLSVFLGWKILLHPRHIIRTRNIPEASVCLLHFLLWGIFILPKFGILTTTMLYLGQTWCASNYMFIHFAMSHTHLPNVSKEDNSVDWVRYAAYHTMNVSPGPFHVVTWVMGYLNYQIEHHLFPAMPQFRNRLIAPRVKALFHKHGLPYHEMSWFGALEATFLNLDNVGKEILNE